MTSTISTPASIDSGDAAASRGLRVSIGSIALGLGLIVGLAPLSWHFGRDLIARDEYAWLVMLVAAGVLFNRRWAELPEGSIRRGPWRWALPMFAAAAVCLVGGMIFYLRWAAAPAVVTAAAAITYRIGGRTLLRCAVPSLILVFLAVPLPSIAANPTLIALQRVAVWASGRVFDVLGLPNVRTGTVIEIPGHRLLVEEACSGVNSLTAIVAFSLLYAFLQKRSAGRALALTIIGAFMALSVNVMRIVIGGFLLGQFGIDLFDAGVHAWIGLGMFAAAIGLVCSADHLLLWLAPPGMRRASGRVPITAFGREGLGAAIGSWGIALAFAAIGVVAAERLHGCWPASRLPSDAVFVAPPQIGDWILDADASHRPTAIASLDVISYSWLYRNGSRYAEVAFTYPFAHGVHDSTQCYAVTGWALSHRLADAESQWTSVDLARPGPTFGHLLFATFDESGNWQPPVAYPRGDWASRRISFERQVATRLPGYELQVLLLSDAPIEFKEREIQGSLFEPLRKSLRSQVLSQLHTD